MSWLGERRRKGKGLLCPKRMTEVSEKHRFGSVEAAAQAGVGVWQQQSMSSRGRGLRWPVVSSHDLMGFVSVLANEMATNPTHLGSNIQGNEGREDW